MTFADKLYTLRKSRSISRAQLAGDLAVTRSTISNYENNIRKPSTDRMWQKIADYFNVSIDYLMNDNLTSPEDSSIPMSVPIPPIEQYNLSDKSVKILSDFLNLPIDEQELFVNFLNKLMLERSDSDD